MEEINIKINSKIKTIISQNEGSGEIIKKEKIKEYDVSVDFDEKLNFIISKADVDSILDMIEPQGIDPTITPFREKIEELNNSILRLFSEKFKANNEMQFLVNIISDDKKIFGLPWEIIKMDYQNTFCKLKNVIIRRLWGGSDNIEIKNGAVFCSSINNFQNLIDDISADMLAEAQIIKNNFKNSSLILPDIDEYQKNNELLGFSGDVVHLAGHGDISGMHIRDKKYITKEELAQVRGKFFYLNFCHSSTQTKYVDSIANYLLDNNKMLKYVIGMRNKINSKYALEFSNNFYINLKETNNVVKSFAYANKMTSSSDGHEFYSVVLYQK
ncbi:MAG: hypothetical protein V1867_00665 [Candidatus Falkowbacteria bacterium]